MTIEQIVEIPASRRITLEVPPQVPIGRAVLTFTTTADSEDECPICAKHRDPETGELRFNSETMAAIEEGDAMLRGEIPTKWYNSLAEMMADLDK